jgi:multiple sugar transport system permease protein
VAPLGSIGPSTSRRPSRKRGGSNRTPLPTSILATTFLFVLSIYFLAPAAWLIINSTKSVGDLFTTGGFALGHKFALWDNLSAVFGRDKGVFIDWLWNSVLYSVVGSAAATLLAAAAGYSLAKHRFRGREAVFSIIMAGVLVPTTALAIPLYLLFSKVSLTDTRWAVLIPSMVSPFGVYLSRVYITAAVPEEMLEAARLDGASEYRIFFSMVLRVISPALVTVFLFQLVAVWNNFLLPLIMLSNDHLYPVTLGLFTWNSNVSHYPELNSLILTGSLVSVIPLVIAFLALQRYWRPGLSSGTTK